MLLTSQLERPIIDKVIESIVYNDSEREASLIKWLKNAGVNVDEVKLKKEGRVYA